MFWFAINTLLTSGNNNQDANSELTDVTNEVTSVNTQEQGETVSSKLTSGNTEEEVTSINSELAPVSTKDELTDVSNEVTGGNGEGAIALEATGEGDWYYVRTAMDWFSGESIIQYHPKKGLVSRGEKLEGYRVEKQ